jgi:hypothetical protein
VCFLILLGFGAQDQLIIPERAAAALPPPGKRCARPFLLVVLFPELFSLLCIFKFWDFSLCPSVCLSAGIADSAGSYEAAVIRSIMLGRETPPFAPFVYKMHRFTKTGSGQT